MQEDDVNKENEIDEERKGYKTYFNNAKLPVTNEDLEDITNKRLLSDNVIHGFNILCRRQCEHVTELQESLSGCYAKFAQMSDFLLLGIDPVIKNQKFVQILHNNRGHWVAISTYNCKNGEVKYYFRAE